MNQCCLYLRYDLCSAYMWWERLKAVIRSQDDLKKWRITSVTWYKENDLVGHEFLVFYVLSVEFANVVHLKVEHPTTYQVVRKLSCEDIPTEAFLARPENVHAAIMYNHNSCL